MDTIQTVMLIDDDEDDRDIFREVMYDINPVINCLISTSGQDALSRLERDEQRPDVIFLDLNLPRMSGKDCLKELKKNQLLENIPVVIYPTSKVKADPLETERLGAFSLVVKP